MIRPLNSAMAATSAPPVMEARRWLEGVTFPPDRPLLNLSQAAPVAPPHEGLRQAIAEAALADDAAHLYGPVLGMPELRTELATRTETIYGGQISAGQVAITAGCNQAFCAVMSTLAGPGDEVILPLPWYFNHKMWLDMTSVAAVPLPTGPALLPDPEQAAALIGPRTRAIVLVTPNNPAGVAYPPGLMNAFRDLARTRGIALVVDETYRDFHDSADAPHTLFEDPDWDDTFIQLYSFSKAYRLTGHRIGAVLAGPQRLAQVEKFLDTVAICPTGLGQRGALWGLRNLDQWLAAERAEILARRDALIAGFAELEGWSLLGCGAYFAYVEHPFALPSDDVARQMVSAASVLMLPGTMFMPLDDPQGRRELRIAFANADKEGLADLVHRLARITI